MSFPARTISGEVVNIVAKVMSDEADGLVVLTDEEGNKWMRRRDADDHQALEPYDPEGFEVAPAAEEEEESSEEDE